MTDVWRVGAVVACVHPAGTNLVGKVGGKRGPSIRFGRRVSHFL